MKKLLVSGARERENWFELGDGKAYDAAKLHDIDLETSARSELLSFETGGEYYPSLDPNLQFTAGCTDGSNLWLPTDTEIRLYEYPSLKLQQSISYPFFQNVHSVTLIGELIAVTSTGLDLVALLNADDGTVVDLVNVEGKPVWHRHSSEIDYRLVHSTRPHQGHPNYVFEIGGDLWVTRCTFDDAVKLYDVSERIDIGRGRDISAHDGVVRDGHVYFTTVDGGISIADPSEKRVVEDIDLKIVESRTTMRGWCRGLMLDEGHAYVGFSRMRKTRNSRKVRWANMLKNARYIEDASVVCYDLASWKKLEEWRFRPGELDAIYGILPEPKATPR
jgi:hypothetical protein